MELLISIKNLDELNIPCDGYILGYEKYASFSAGYFSFEDIKRVSETKKVFVLLNALINEDDLEDAKRELDKLKSLGVSFIVQDIGLLYYLIRTYDKERIIFNPYTLICNKEDLKEYQKDGVTVFVSNVASELDTLLDDKTALLVYGYQPIYQSYRKVLSLYEEGHGLTLKEKDLYIKENTRDDLHHIVENEYGTVIFDSKVVNEINIRNINARYWIIDSSYLEDKEIHKMVKEVHKCVR